MTLEEAIERLEENLIELPHNAKEYDQGYMAAITDLKDLVDEDKEDRR